MGRDAGVLKALLFPSPGPRMKRRWWLPGFRKSRSCRENYLECRNDFQWRATACGGSPNGVMEGINTLSSPPILLRDWLKSKRNQKAKEPVDIVSNISLLEGTDQGGEGQRVGLEKQTKTIWHTSQTTN